MLIFSFLFLFFEEEVKHYIYRIELEELEDSRSLSFFVKQCEYKYDSFVPSRRNRSIQVVASSKEEDGKKKKVFNR